MSDTKEKNKDENVIEKEVAKIIKSGVKRSKKDFAKFSAVVAVLFSAGLWLLKSVWYAYQSGRISVYGIDRCYINTDNESVFLQIIQMAAILTVWYCVSTIYYKISISEDESFFHWKRKVKKLQFWIIEMVVLFGIILAMSGISIIDVVKELTIVYAVAYIVLMWAICLVINIFGIMFARDYKSTKKKKETDEAKQVESPKVKKSKYQRMSRALISAVVIVAAELLLISVISYHIEYDRCAYKVIEVKSSLNKDHKYALEYSSESPSYELYPVVFENQECYIVSKLYQEGDEIKIDYNYQKIIPKDGVETYMFSDIYGIEVVN